jgi:hypothetical protein
LRIFRNIRIEIVHEHSHCRFLDPSFAGDRGSAGSLNYLGHTSPVRYDVNGCDDCVLKYTDMPSGSIEKEKAAQISPRRLPLNFFYG